MPFFSPPTAALVPAAVKPQHPGFALMRHYQPWQAGINVFIIGGQVTTQEPDYATVTPDHVFLGSHIYEVDGDVAALLTAAGYNLLDYTPPTPSVPLPGTDLPDWDVDLEPSYGLQSHLDLDAIYDTARYA